MGAGGGGGNGATLCRFRERPRACFGLAQSRNRGFVAFCCPPKRMEGSSCLPCPRDLSFGNPELSRFWGSGSSTAWVTSELEVAYMFNVIPSVARYDAGSPCPGMRQVMPRSTWVRGASTARPMTCPLEIMLTALGAPTWQGWSSQAALRGQFSPARHGGGLVACPGLGASCVLPCFVFTSLAHWRDFSIHRPLQWERLCLVSRTGVASASSF